VLPKDDEKNDISNEVQAALGLEKKSYPKTASQRAFEIAREKRKASRIAEEIKMTHREKMDRYNSHLSKLCECMDMPRLSST
jgi:hypothetical protein